MAFNQENHTDSFQPPGGQEPFGDAKSLFQFLSGLFLIAVHVLGVFWAMLSKLPGTVGTREYWFDMLCGVTLLTALSQNSWYPDRYLFQGSIVLLIVLYFRHLFTTLYGKKHVHTKCIGTSRFGTGDDGKLWEAVVGVATGISICLAGCQPYGLFVIASAVANTIKVAMVDERDRHRSVQMADAMAEQEYMMEHYEKFQHERTNR